MLRKTVSLSLFLLFAVCWVWVGGDAGAVEKKGPVVVALLVYGKHNLPTLEGFKAGLAEKGHGEGTSITYLFDGPTENKEELDTLMAKLMTGNPDLIFAATTPAALAAKKATAERKIPVVFAPVNDPVLSGVVPEQKRPGGNITGVMLADSTGKQLEWALRMNPAIKTVLFPYNPTDKSSLVSLQQIKEAGTLFNVTITPQETPSQAAIDALLAEPLDGIDAIFLPRDAMIMSRGGDFAALALRKKILLSGTRKEMAQRGALFSYGFEGVAIGRQAARIADLILKGKNPGELPVETAAEFLAINLKTAGKIGLTIDEHILRQAQEIIRGDGN